jgi:hypothetical protein
MALGGSSLPKHMIKKFFLITGGLVAILVAVVTLTTPAEKTCYHIGTELRCVDKFIPPAQTQTTTTANDAAPIYKLAAVLQASGAITDYKIGTWADQLDVWISSLLPGDAREVATAGCKLARQKFQSGGYSTLRVFLVVGDHPAATCRF